MSYFHLRNTAICSLIILFISLACALPALSSGDKTLEQTRIALSVEQTSLALQYQQATQNALSQAAQPAQPTPAESPTAEVQPTYTPMPTYTPYPEPPTQQASQSPTNRAVTHRCSPRKYGGSDPILQCTCIRRHRR